MADLPALARRLHVSLDPGAVGYHDHIERHGATCSRCALILSALEEATRAERERPCSWCMGGDGEKQEMEAEAAALREEVEALKARVETLLETCVNLERQWQTAQEQVEQAHRAGRREALREVLPYADCSRCAPEEDCRLAALRAEAEGGEG